MGIKAYPVEVDFRNHRRPVWPGRLTIADLWWAILVCVWLGFMGISGRATAGALPSVERRACLSATGQQAVTRCFDALQKDPHDSELRLTLSDALVQLHRYRQAINVLRKGLELEPDNDEIKSRLTRAEQMREEYVWIEKQKQKRERAQATGLTSQQRIEAGRFEIRCAKLSGELALRACNEGLERFPGHPVLYAGKGNALMAMERYGEAIEAFQDALTINPDDASTRSALKKSRILRKVSAKKCMELSGHTALEACNAAVKKGSLDEVAIRQRQGDLLSALGRTKEAAAAYEAALAVDGSNPTITGKLKALGVETADRSAPAAAPSSMTASAGSQAAIPSASAKPVPGTKPAAQVPPTVPRPVKAVPKPPTETFAEVKPATRDIAARHPEVVADAVPRPAPPEKAHGKFSNAPLPSGFTH